MCKAVLSLKNSCCVIDTNLDAVVAVIEHAHEVPGEGVWLSVHGFIPCSAPQLLRPQQLHCISTPAITSIIDPPKTYTDMDLSSSIAVQHPPSKMHSVKDVAWLASFNFDVHAITGRVVRITRMTETSFRQTVRHYTEGLIRSSLLLEECMPYVPRCGTTLQRLRVCE